MIGEKRAKEIEYKARKQRESLAGVSSTAPVNVQVRLQIYSLLWELKQKYYRDDVPLSYASKSSYEAELCKVDAIERRIIASGFDEERARKAVAEAREYLNIILGNRVRDNRRCRVF